MKLCCLLVPAVIWSAALPAMGGAELTVSNDSFDFGYAPQNATVTHTYWLKNTGDAELEIQKVIPGCGCTKAPLLTDRVPAGDSTPLEITFSTHRYTGNVVKSPIIQTNSKISRMMVKFSSQVVFRPDSLRPVTVMPYKCDVSQLGSRIRDRIEFTISNPTAEDLTLALVDVPKDFFSVELPASVGAGSSATGLLVVPEDKLGEEFEKSFTFEVGDDIRSRYTVPVKRSVRSAQASKAPANQE